MIDLSRRRQQIRPTRNERCPVSVVDARDASNVVDRVRFLDWVLRPQQRPPVEIIMGCGGVVTVPDLDSGDRRFESCHPDQQINQIARPSNG